MHPRHPRMHIASDRQLIPNFELRVISWLYLSRVRKLVSLPSGNKLFPLLFYFLARSMTSIIGSAMCVNQPRDMSFRARAHWPLCSTTCGRVFVAGTFIPVGNHYFQALASTLQFVAQVCDRLWLVPATDRAVAYITYMSPPHVALVCSGPPQCAATCGWTKWPVCSGPYF